MREAGYTVVVPLDGSALSEQALGFAELLARTLEARLELTLVLEDSATRGDSPPLEIAERKLADEYLAGVRGRVEGLPTRATVLVGPVVEQVLQLAERSAPAIIVMSTHGRGGLKRMMFGSVADKIVRSGAVPVAIIRPREGPGTATWYLQRLLVPLDGSALAENALPLATELARRSGAELRLVRAVEPFWGGPYGAYAPEAMYLPADQIDALMKDAENDAREYLDRIATGLREQGIQVTWDVSFGRAEDDIIEAAQRTHADVILMSTHGWGGIRRWALGSVTDEVSHRTDIPMIVIPAATRG